LPQLPEQLHQLDFNPRTREGCDTVNTGILIIPETISIHAPVKGATLNQRFLKKGIRISIHAPVKGATGEIEIEYGAIRISIHAPVKGATGDLKE